VGAQFASDGIPRAHPLALDIEGGEPLVSKHVRDKGSRVLLDQRATRGELRWIVLDDLPELGSLLR